MHKTTLLNVLAGVKTKGLKVYGDVQSSFETNPIYVQQEDLLFPQLTVQETLETASKLRSSNSDPKAVGSQLLEHGGWALAPSEQGRLAKGCPQVRGRMTSHYGPAPSVGCHGLSAFRQMFD